MAPKLIANTISLGMLARVLMIKLHLIKVLLAESAVAVIVVQQVQGHMILPQESAFDSNSINQVRNVQTRREEL